MTSVTNTRLLVTTLGALTSRSQVNTFRPLVQVCTSTPTQSLTLYNHQSQSFATNLCPERLRPGPHGGRTQLQKHKINKQKEDPYFGFLGRGIKINDAKRRWRGGRYNYFDWPTLKQAIYNCPSAIEKDRMPSAGELNYMYRGASIGVKHHGGFAIVAQMLNLSPKRPWVTKLEDFPVWIEENEIERKLNENLSKKNKKAPSPPHRHCLPPFLRNLYKETKNIQGKVLSKVDKRRLIKNIYIKINKRLYEEDTRKREEIQNEWETYKRWIRDKKIIEEVEQGFLHENEYKYETEDPIEGTISNITRKLPKISQQPHYSHQLKSTNNKHILLQNDTHIVTKEEKDAKKKQTGVRGRLNNIRDKVPFLKKK